MSFVRELSESVVRNLLAIARGRAVVQLAGLWDSSYSS